MIALTILSNYWYTLIKSYNSIVKIKFAVWFKCCKRFGDYPAAYHFRDFQMDGWNVWFAITHKSVQNVAKNAET